MMDHMWVYEGDVSPDGKVLSLYTRGPDFQSEGAEQDYREQITFIDDDHRTLHLGSQAAGRQLEAVHGGALRTHAVIRNDIRHSINKA